MVSQYIYFTKDRQEGEQIDRQDDAFLCFTLFHSLEPALKFHYGCSSNKGHSFLSAPHYCWVDSGICECLFPQRIAEI